MRSTLEGSTMKQLLLVGLFGLLCCTGGCTKLACRGGCTSSSDCDPCCSNDCGPSCGSCNSCGPYYGSCNTGQCQVSECGCHDQCGGGARGLCSSCQSGVCTGCRPAPIHWQQGGLDYAHKLTRGMLRNGQVTQNPGPPAASIGYPYYTVRGPRDFLAKNPPSMGR